MKKLLCFIILLLFTASTCMAADVNITYNADTQEMTVGGTASGASKLVTVMVTAGNVEWDEIDSTQNPLEQLSKLSYFSQVRTSDDSTFLFSFKLTDIPDNIKGVYSARIYDETQNRIFYSDEIVCYSANAADSALLAVNGAEDEDSIKKALEDYGEILNVDAEKLDTFPKEKRNFIFGFLFANKPYESCEKLCAEVAIATELSSVKYASDGAAGAKILLEKGSGFGFDSECAFDIYCSDDLFDSKLREAVAKDMQKASDDKFYTAESMKSLFAECVILNGCYGNKWSSVDIILKTAKPLEVYNMTRFETAKDTAKVCKYINNNKYSSLDELADAVEDYLNNPPKTEDKKTSSSSSGSSYSASIPTSSAVEPEVSKPAGFADMAGFEWASTAVEYLREKNIISGKGENKFEPESFVKREEFAKMIALALNLQFSDDADFVDVDDKSWYAEYVNAVFGSGLMKGDSEECFGVGRELTRQDIAVILHRAMGMPNPSGDAPMFIDEEDIAPYAKTSVTTLASMGIISGMGEGRFAPNEAVTRAQAAKLLYEMLMRL